MEITGKKILGGTWTSDSPQVSVTPYLHYTSHANKLLTTLWTQERVPTQNEPDGEGMTTFYHISFTLPINILLAQKISITIKKPSFMNRPIFKMMWTNDIYLVLTFCESICKVAGYNLVFLCVNFGQGKPEKLIWQNLRTRKRSFSPQEIQPC